MKNAELKKIAKATISNSPEFTCGNVKYELEDSRIRIWSDTEEFHSLSLVCRFTDIFFNIYAAYNYSEKRVELIMFWVEN